MKLTICFMVGVLCASVVMGGDEQMNGVFVKSVRPIAPLFTMLCWGTNLYVRPFRHGSPFPVSGGYVKATNAVCTGETTNTVAFKWGHREFSLARNCGLRNHNAYDVTLGLPGHDADFTVSYDIGVESEFRIGSNTCWVAAVDPGGTNVWVVDTITGERKRIGRQK